VKICERKLLFAVYFSFFLFYLIFLLKTVAEAAYNKNYNYYDYPPAAALIIVIESVIKTTHELIPPFC